MHLSVYGDSIAAGEGAPPGMGFVPELARLSAVQRRNAVTFFNFGQSGMTSGDLASAFAQNDAWLDGLMQADTVCLLIGGDDLIRSIPLLLTANRRGLERTLLDSAAHWRRILAVVRRHSHGPVAVGTLYDPFPATPAAARAVAAYNECVIAPAAAASGAALAPVHQAFSGRQSALIDGYANGRAGAPGRDGVAHPVHPNARGHAVIARVFASQVE